MVIHTMSGFLAGTDSTFNDVNRDASTHFGIGLNNPTVHQYVNLSDGAWGNGVLEAGERWTQRFGAGSPNKKTVSIETEDSVAGQPIGSVPVSDHEYDLTLRLIKTVILPRHPSIKVLTGHHVISPLSRKLCPGPRWTGGRIQSLASALGLELFI